MDEFLAICQGLGLALAAGVGGVLVPLFAAALASFGFGWDLEGHEFEFVGEPLFLTILLAVNVAGFAIRTRAWAPNLVVAVVALAAGILFAASLTEAGLSPWPGLAAGALIGFLAGALAADVLRAAARRAARSGDPEKIAAETNGLILLASGGGLLLTLASLLLPPLGLVALLALAALALNRRRAAGGKYAGLRILR